MPFFSLKSLRKKSHGFGPIKPFGSGGEQKLIEVTIEEIPTVSVKTKPRFLIANAIFTIVFA